MNPRDHVTDTVADAAKYERRHFGEDPDPYPWDFDLTDSLEERAEQKRRAAKEARA